MVGIAFYRCEQNNRKDVLTFFPGEFYHHIMAIHDQPEFVLHENGGDMEVPLLV